jgi:hypothetical protein
MIVISHFHNEEYLLPFWLKHHKKIFDHGILIDSNSTDKSVEIIQKIVPDWEIVKSPMKMFDSVKMDELIMEIERKHEEKSKIVLNSTEFLMVSDFDTFRKLTSKPKSIHQIPTALMVDTTPNENPSKVDNLLEQKSFGVWHDALNVFYLNKKYKFTKQERGRFIHTFKDGQYLPGRHATYLNAKRLSRKIAYIRWYYYSPWNDVTIARKLNIRNTLSENDKKNNLSIMHFLEEDLYYEIFRYLQKKAHKIPSYDLVVYIRIFIIINLRNITKIIFKIKYSKLFRKFLRLILPTKKIRKKVSELIWKN